MVLRIFCKTNYAKRKESKIKYQYTITILPSFLHPYSHITIHSIAFAIDEYLNGKSKNYVEAAMDMCAESDRTFRTYYYRVRKRVQKWISLLISLSGQLNYNSGFERIPDTKSKNMKKLWDQFNLTAQEYFCACESLKIPAGIVMQKQLYRQFVFSILITNGTGLGP